MQPNIKLGKKNQPAVLLPIDTPVTLLPPELRFRLVCWPRWICFRSNHFAKRAALIMPSSGECGTNRAPSRKLHRLVRLFQKRHKTESLVFTICAPKMFLLWPSPRHPTAVPKRNAQSEPMHPPQPKANVSIQQEKEGNAKAPAR